MDRVRDIRFRVYLTFSFIILFAIMIIGKALYIQIVKGDELREMASKMHQRTEKLVPDRGNIYSEDGTLLVSSTPRFDLRVDMKVITNDTLRKYIDEIAKGLSTILNDNSTAYYKNKIITAHKNKDRYFLLKKNAKYYEYQQVRALPIFNKAKNKGGFIVEARSERDNPFKLLAFRTLGLWRENASNVGIEQKYDTILSGKPGSRMLRKTTGNTWVPIEDLLIEPVNGKDIVSTIDINIQDVTEHALLESLQKHGCQFGTAVVMEVATGKIKAMANLGKQKDGSYWEDYNYALTLSEPGSTFKLMSLYALLEDDYVKITDNVNVEGGLKVFGKQRVRDDHLGMGTVTIEKAFAKSSNVAFAKLINQFYAKDPMRYINHLRKMHLHEKTGIDLVGEVTPIIKTTNSKSWNKVTSLPWIAYGYESLITPLHTLMVYNAIANNGKMMKPYLVSEIQEYGKTIKKIEPVVLEEKLGKKSTIQQLRKAMKRLNHCYIILVEKLVRLRLQITRCLMQMG
jgi:cell division protein FtsI (penicillin-binding protein 3)